MVLLLWLSSEGTVKMMDAWRECDVQGTGNKSVMMYTADLIFSFTGTPITRPDSPTGHLYSQYQD